MIRKITGKNKNNKHVHIKSNGNICSTTKDISNALGENFQKNSSSANYSETFQNIKQEREKEHLNFTSLNHEKYNVPFTASELLDALHNLMIQLLVLMTFIIKFLNIYPITL